MSVIDQTRGLGSRGDPWAEVLTIGDVLVRGALRHPDREAVILPPERRSYRQLLEGARRVARGLWALGVRPRDHVGILMPNSVECLEAFFGIALLGGVSVPINARYKSTELRYVIENADLVTVLTTDLIEEHVDFAEILRESLPGLSTSPDATRLDLADAPALRNVVMQRGRGGAGLVGEGEIGELSATADAATVDELRHRVRLRDVATIVYTSGTTAHPKGCMLTHEAIVRTSVARGVERLERSEQERLWCPGPLFHVGAIAPMVGSIALGDTYLTMTHFDPREALAMVERERVTTLWPLFASLARRFIDDPSFPSTDLSHVVQFPCSGPPDGLRAMQRAFPEAQVMSAYGMTETCAVIVLPDAAASGEERMQWSGTPYRGIDLAIADPDSGAHLPPGELGEICVRGYCCMEGYYRDPRQTAKSIDADGWFHTGDLGSLDEHGRLAFQGRLKDMLKVGGENVGVVEVESFLLSHPAVRHAEVVGMPDPRLDEVPAAFVELHEDAVLSEQALIDYCRNRIARYKTPRHVRFVSPDEWPMSATKVNKVVLRDRIRAELGSPEAQRP